MPPRPDAVNTRPPRRNLIRGAWRKIALRNLTASDNHRQLDRLYALPDPWDMNSAREQYRCVMTNAIIESKLGRVKSILEIGCGEGHQSRHLAALCDQLYGLDVSPRAVARAQKRIPEALIEVGSLPVVPWTPPGGQFDLVVACEVLYYVSDIPAVIDRMSELGRTCLVTFFSPSAGLVAGHVDQLTGVDRGWFHHDPYAWLWAMWQKDHQ